MTFLKSISRFLSPAKHGPEIHLAAFGKHPGWNDHTDDLGLDTDALVSCKRMLYMQGISQNIDVGAWEKLETAAPAMSSPTPVSPSTAAAAASSAAAPAAEETSGTSESTVSTLPQAEIRLEAFRHDFLWHMPPAPPTILLAGRFWSSVDGKGRDKYPMVLCSQLTDLPVPPGPFAARVVLPFLAEVHQRCVLATTANTVREIIDADRETLKARAAEGAAKPSAPLTAGEIAAAADHPSMSPAKDESGAVSHIGFLRIVYQFAGTMSSFRPSSTKSMIMRRPEQLRLPTCGLSPTEAMLFWLRFAQSLLDPSTPLLLLAPDQPAAPWVDMIVGDPTPQNLFCIKAGTKSIPYTSEIPYTLDPSFQVALETHLAHLASMPEGAVPPEWPV